MRTLEQITEHLNNLDDNTLITAWNDYQSNISSENQLYSFDDEFFEMFFENRPQECARAVFFGNVQNWGDEYIYFNGYANLESTNNPLDVITISELAEYISENPQYFDYIIDEIEEVDEEEA